MHPTRVAWVTWKFRHCISSEICKPVSDNKSYHFRDFSRSSGMSVGKCDSNRTSTTHPCLKKSRSVRSGDREGHLYENGRNILLEDRRCGYGPGDQHVHADVPNDLLRKRRAVRCVKWNVTIHIHFCEVPFTVDNLINLLTSDMKVVAVHFAAEMNCSLATKNKLCCHASPFHILLKPQDSHCVCRSV